MAKQASGRRPTNQRDGARKVVKLMADYRKAQANHRAKLRAARETATRLREVGIRLEEALASTSLPVHRTVYLVESREGRRTVRKVIGGKNLRAVPGILAAASETTIDFEFAEDCGPVMDEHDTQNQACVCYDLGGDPPMVAVVCIEEGGEFPEEP